MSRVQGQALAVPVVIGHHPVVGVADRVADVPHVHPGVERERGVAPPEPLSDHQAAMSGDGDGDELALAETGWDSTRVNPVARCGKDAANGSLLVAATMYEANALADRVRNGEFDIAQRCIRPNSSPEAVQSDDD